MTDAPWGPDHPAWVPGLDDDSIEQAIARAYSVPAGVTNARDMTGGDAHDAVDAGFRRHQREQWAREHARQQEQTLAEVLRRMRDAGDFEPSTRPPRFSRNQHAMTREDAMDVERARREGRIVDG